MAEELADTGFDSMTRRAQAAALVAVVQQTTEAIGDAVLADADRESTRKRLVTTAGAALDHLSTWCAPA